MPQPSRNLSAALSGDPARVNLGVLTYCFENAKKARTELPAVPNFSDPATFIREAWAIGANAVQIPFGILERSEIKRLRELAAAKRMHLESTVGCPLDDASDLARFAAELRTLRELGVTVARTVVFGGRRYETFKSLEEFRAGEQSAREKLRRAIPIARENGVRLALENHKDQRVEERLRLLEEFSCETLGACLDVGNSLALLEDPIDVAEAFAPWTTTVHFKDQGVREYEGGFLLADVPLGQGCIDLRRVIATIRAKQPQVHLQLELITRDALEVPTLRDDYWRTFPELPASRLAASLAMLKAKGSPRDFPRLSNQTVARRVEMERRNIEQSFAYAGKHLGLSA